jgi:sugar phosphate permease
MDEQQVEEPTLRDPKGPCFQAVRIFCYGEMCLLYMLVFFINLSPSVLAEPMAVNYNVPKADLGIFSSVFFYPYALLQPFAGLLADIIEVGYLVGCSHLLAATGIIIVGASKSIGVACVGRALSGLGCSCSFVPIFRSALNWFPFSIAPVMSGMVLSFGSIGGMLAQAPLASLAERIGWRACFFGIGVIDYILSAICLLFARGTPVARGYKPVNPGVGEQAKLTFKESLVKLWHNFRTVIAYPWFWCIAAYAFQAIAVFFDLSGMWIVPWLRDAFGMTKQEAGNTALGLSIGTLVGAVGVPRIAAMVKTKKWTMVGFAALLILVIVIIWELQPKHLPVPVLWICLILIGGITNGTVAVAYSLLSEYFEKATAGTAIGCANLFAFMSVAVFQAISSQVIKSKGKIRADDRDLYTHDGYQLGLWLIFLILSVGATIIAFIAREGEVVLKAEDVEEDEKELPSEGS